MFSKTLWFCAVALSASLVLAEPPRSKEAAAPAPKFQIRLEFLAVPDQKAWQKLGLKPTKLREVEANSPEQLDHEPLLDGEAAIRLVSATHVTESRSPFQFQVVTREQLRRSISGLEACLHVLSTQMIVASGETGAKHYPAMNTEIEMELPEGPGVQPLEEANLLEKDIHILARPDLCDDGSVDLACQWELSRMIDPQASQRTVSRVKLLTNLQPGETLAIWCDSQSAADLIAGTKRFPIRRAKPIPLVLLVTPRGPLTPEAERVLAPPSTVSGSRQHAVPVGR